MPHSEHGDGIELMGHSSDSPSAQDVSPKIPASYTAIEVLPSDSGYDTDATMFSEGAFSDDTEDDDEVDALALETGGLLGRQRVNGAFIQGAIAHSACTQMDWQHL